MPLLTDTSPEIAEIVRSRVMAHSPAERFLMGIRMFDAAREMVLASFPADLSPESRRPILFERLYGQPLPIGFRKDAAEQGIAESEALESGMQEKARDFTERGAKIYANG